MSELDDLQTHRESFAANAKPHQKSPSSDQNVYGGLIFADGSYQQVGKWVCHGFINHYNLPPVLSREGNSKKVVKRIFSATMCSHADAGTTTKFYDWLINRSPWAHTHLDHDVERCQKYGFVVDATGPYNIFLSGLIASRFMTESYDSNLKPRIQTYTELLSTGFTEEEAFLFAHLYGSQSSKLYPMTFSPYSSGHSIFPARDIDEEYLRNFLTQIFKNPSDKLPKDGYDVNGGMITSLWGEKASKNSFYAWAKCVKPVSNVQSKNLNIFERKASEEFVITNRKDLLTVINQVKERIYA